MQTDQNLKEIVKEKYGQIAKGNQNSCSSSCCCISTENVMCEDYNELNGYNSDADLGLGCGLPTKFAQIKKGDTVIDLGSGAGNDCFVARAEVGESGKVIGLDFTPEMIEKARLNVAKLGFTNVEFIHSDIEKMSVDSNIADVVVSNCVLNLVPNKQAVFHEIFRVLKDKGHFSISDIVLIGSLPQKLQTVAEMYAGCVSGAIEKDMYLKHIKDAGFKNITIQKEKTIILPDEELTHYLTDKEIEEYKKEPDIIKSITVYAEK